MICLNTSARRNPIESGWGWPLVATTAALLEYSQSVPAGTFQRKSHNASRRPSECSYRNAICDSELIGTKVLGI